MTARERGILGYVMPPEVNGPTGDQYALFVREDGAMLMVHSEGVGYSVSSDKPWRWTDYAECDLFSPEALTALLPSCERVDLADWVRTFGARLESNFWGVVRWTQS